MAQDSSPPTDTPVDPYAEVPVDLKNRELALLLAWLLPGGGHLYQGRRGKGILFMVCILSTYFLGLSMGGGHVVYAKWDSQDKRLPFLCQVGVGAPALPALVQTFRVTREQEPILIFGKPIMAPPADTFQLDEWHREYGFLFEMGTLYTMIAGLLNILVMYDAYAGPVFMIPDSMRKKLAEQEAKAPPNPADSSPEPTTPEPSDPSNLASKSR